MRLLAWVEDHLLSTARLTPSIEANRCKTKIMSMYTFATPSSHVAATSSPDAPCYYAAGTSDFRALYHSAATPPPPCYKRHYDFVFISQDVLTWLEKQYYLRSFFALPPSCYCSANHTTSTSNATSPLCCCFVCRGTASTPTSALCYCFRYAAMLCLLCVPYVLLALAIAA